MLSELDALVEASMAEWKVPGLALAVIRDGEPLDAAGQLMLRISGQPSRRLLPFDRRTFDLDGLEGYRVAFRCSEAGEVESLVFHQPNGVFVARRAAPSV